MWISWDCVCLPKKDKGLRVKNLHQFNLIVFWQSGIGGFFQIRKVFRSIFLRQCMDNFRMG